MQDKEIHIGRLVKSVFDSSHLSVSEFARQLHCDRSNELWNEEEGDTEEDKKKKANKKRHKDTDARWTKKGGQKFYGYKTHTKIDAKAS